MKSDSSDNTHIYGVATVGERGQLVIPSEARKNADFRPGDKIVVIGHPPNALVLVKMDAFKPFLSSLTEYFSNIEDEHSKDSGKTKK